MSNQIEIHDPEQTPEWNAGYACALHCWPDCMEPNTIDDSAVDSIPDGDYDYLQANGIADPDNVQYWLGVNACIYDRNAKINGEARLQGCNWSVALLQNAYAENHQDGIAYFASAIDRAGNKYLVRWDRTRAYELACELAGLLEYRDYYEDIAADDDTTGSAWDSDMYEEKRERLAELEAMDGLPDPNDESYACDWDNPADIERMD